MIDDKDLIKGIGRHGYETEDQHALADLWKNLPDGFQLTQAYFRDVISKRDYLSGLGDLGYTPKTANMLEEIAWQLPGPSDLMRFGVREVFTPSIAARFGQYQQYPEAMTKWAAKIGMSKEIARMYWAAHWDLPAIGQMFSMFHRGIIGRADLKMGVRAADVMPFWQDKVIDLSYRLIPRRTLPRLIRQGMVKPKDAVLRFRRLGFNPDDSGIMAESASLAAVEEEREMTKADILSAVRFGWWTLEQAKTALEGMQYSETAVEFYLADAERRKALEDARTAAGATIDDTVVAIDLTRSEVVRGYSAGMVERKAAEAMLQAVGASAEAAAWKLQYADLVRAREAKEHVARHYKRLFDNHLRDGTAIENALLTAGYTATESKRLVAAWTLERDVDDELAAVRDRRPTVADLDKWLKLGILTVDDWVEGMAEQGYPDPVIAMNLEEIILTMGA
jgi:SOS response regulatory protein OraA/RecX